MEFCLEELSFFPFIAAIVPFCFFFLTSVFFPSELGLSRFLVAGFFAMVLLSSISSQNRYLAYVNKYTCNLFSLAQQIYGDLDVMIDPIETITDTLAPSTTGSLQVMKHSANTKCMKPASAEAHWYISTPWSYCSTGKHRADSTADIECLISRDSADLLSTVHDAMKINYHGERMALSVSPILS